MNKSFEVGSVLAPSDHATRRQLARIVMLGLGAIIFAVAFIAPLLK